VWPSKIAQKERRVADNCGLGESPETIVARSQSGRENKLEERVARVAEAALSRQQYVSALWHGASHIVPCRFLAEGRIDFLERLI
jgi:hypothetical protein